MHSTIETCQVPQQLSLRLSPMHYAPGRSCSTSQALLTRQRGGSQTPFPILSLRSLQQHDQSQPCPANIGSTRRARRFAIGLRVRQRDRTSVLRRGTPNYARHRRQRLRVAHRGAGDPNPVSTFHRWNHPGPAPEALAVFKAMGDRPKDSRDIRTTANTNPVKASNTSDSSGDTAFG